jgi:hypothetical protein
VSKASFERAKFWRLKASGRSQNLHWFARSVGSLELRAVRIAVDARLRSTKPTAF